MDHLMNGKSEPLERSPGEFILFALVFVGFVIAAIGVVTTTAPVCVTGLILMGLGIGGFVLMR